MRTQRRSWRQKVQQHLFIFVGIVVTIFVFIVFTLAVFKFGWDWTGFTTVIGPTLHPNERYQPAKTLWDALQLLIVPIILAIGGFLLNQIQKDRDNKAEEAQKMREADAAKEREKLERESREDNQRETVLQTYIDKMSELLLEKDLRGSQPQDEVRTIARTRTLTILPRLDNERKRSVLLFLVQSDLILNEERKVVLALPSADLSGANLSRTNLAKSFLVGVNLRGADLSGTHMANSSLVGADLSGANLSRTNLQEVNLRAANFSGANLSDAGLIGVDLSGANLSDAKVTPEQLDEAQSLMGAIMPDGSRHP